MVHPTGLVIAIQTTQGIASLVLAMLLLVFYRNFGHGFLRHWALAAAALGVYQGLSSAALGLAWTGESRAALRLLFSMASLAAAYAHVAWLMLGTWEALKQRSVPTRRVWALVATAALVGVASAAVVPFDPEARGLRMLVRVELRYALTGLAFVLAGVVLWRAQERGGMVGARLGSIGFTLYGLQMFHVVAINAWMRLGHPMPTWTPYLGLPEFLFQVLYSLGIIVWLLEIQRQASHRARSQLRHARLHDPTTGLPNRALLVEQLESLMQQRGAAHVAVVCLGANRFGLVHRGLGWRRAEQLMRRIGLRIHHSLGNRCMLGRLSERDFLIARPTLDTPEMIRDWVESLLGVLARPVELDGEELCLTFCAGVSMYPEDGRDAETLIERAQHALMQSGQIGRDVTLFLHAETGRQGEAMLRFETELRRAADEKQFEMHFQPIVDAASGEAASVEALLRWRHPLQGIRLPETFLDEAASIGVLARMEHDILRMSLEQLARWHRAGRTSLTVSVNLSAQRFGQPDIVDEILRQCRESGVEPQFLELEITENTAIQDMRRASETIEALREAGVRISLDDFGSGYSSLASLRKLPVDCIKLDRGFLEDLEADPRQRELIKAVVDLGHSLGMQVVAEGVERPGQRAFLRDIGCDRLQGFLLQRPAPAAECRFRFLLDDADPGR